MDTESDDASSPRWRQRPRPIGFEIAYRLVGDTLEIDSTRKVDRVALADVEQVRFFYAPSNVSRRGFRTQLRLANGRSVTFGNLSWRSFTDIARDDDGYRAFVEALARRIVAANPKARFVAGKPGLLWALLALVSGGALLMLLYFTLSAFRQGAHNTALLGLALAALSWWQVRPMVTLNRPRTLAPGEVPDELVPGRSEAA